MGIFGSRWLRGRAAALISVGAVCGLAIVLLSLTLMVTRGFDETRALRAEVIRSYETRTELLRILSLHQDMETAQRGYQLTQDPKFLEPYTNAVQRLDTTFARLDNSLLTHSPLRPQLARLHQLSHEKRAFVEWVIRKVREGDPALAHQRVSEGFGKQTMDAVRLQIERMDANEQAQLVERTARADSALLSFQRFDLIVNVLLFLAIALAVWLAVRSHVANKSALKRLEDASKRQIAILDGAKDGMIVLNPSASIESLNPAAATMFGYTPDELLRRDIGVLFEVAPDRDQVQTFLNRLDAGGKMGRVQEFSGARKDGTVFPAEVAVSPIQLADRTIFLSVIRDVTARKQIEEMKNEFVSIVSHELRTPLTSIGGSLGLLAGGAAGEIPERALRLIEIARSNCARLVRLINDMLDIEKIEAGKVRFDLKPIALAAALEQALHANRSFAEEYGVALELQPVPADAVVRADEDRLMQVMANLLSNAAKFSPAGGTVRISVTPLMLRHRISIADSGVGISEEFRERIFSKFAQADSSITRQKGGTGLGLSIVKEIVARMHGSVSFESEPGAGTVFHVDLPSVAPAAADDAVEMIETDPRGDELQLLHVDDDPDMLRIVAGVFDGKANVRSTPSLAEARAAILRHYFDAVILDIDMEDGNGLDLIPPLRRNGSRIPIVIFTAHDTSLDQIQGADAVLIKSRASLEKLADMVLRLSRAERRKQGQRP